MRYKALIFDFFGVISSEVATSWFEGLPGSKGKGLKEQFVTPADRGAVSQLDLFKKLSEVSSMSAEEIETDWLSRAHINVELVEYIKELKGSYRLGLLTNAFSPFFTSVLERSGIKDLFEAVVISSETGHVKPEPEMYYAILQEMELLSEEVLMIDDSSINVEGAKSVGMNGLVYTSIQELRKHLEE